MYRLLLYLLSVSRFEMLDATWVNQKSGIKNKMSILDVGNIWTYGKVMPTMIFKPLYLGVLIDRGQIMGFGQLGKIDDTLTNRKRHTLPSACSCGQM